MTVDTLREFEEQAIQLLVRYGIDRETIQLMRPPRREFGDLSTNVAFELAASTGDRPRSVAQRILDSTDTDDFDLISRAVVAGPGYLNFYLDYEVFGPRTLRAIGEARDHYGDLAPETQQAVLIEHTSVNPNKPWHIGHSRNAILGDTLGRMFRKAGYTVEIQNYIDDTGKQVADTVFALERFKTSSPAQAKFDHFAGELYVRLQQELALAEAALTEAVQAAVPRLMHELEEGLHRPFVQRCVDAQLETAWRLGIFYDLLVWESDIVQARLLEEAMTRIESSDYVYVATDRPQEGCLIIRMADFLGHSGGETQNHHIDRILIRSTGVPTYTAKDIAFQMWKFGLLQRDMKYALHRRQPNGRPLWTTHPTGEDQARPSIGAVVNVIGFEQEYPQTAVRAALKILGFEKQYENCHHLSYGHVWLPEGRMSGRKGLGESADEVLEATIAKALRVVREKRGQELTQGEMRNIAEAVGVGAFRFAMLRKKPAAQVLFHLSELVNFSGYTSLYLQYAYVRASSILDRAKEQASTVDEDRALSRLRLPEMEEERALILRLPLLPSELRRAVSQRNPSLICQYGYDLAQAFSQFYKTSPVLDAPDQLKPVRLRLVECTSIVLRIVMELLHVPVLSAM